MKRKRIDKVVAILRNLNYSPDIMNWKKKAGVFLRRTPQNYDGIEPTARSIQQLLPEALNKLGQRFSLRPDLILSEWPKIIGEKLAPMTEAVSFRDGELTVKVKNSSLYSLLARQEKPRLLKLLQEKFPSSGIRNIIFRLG